LRQWSSLCQYLDSALPRLLGLDRPFAESGDHHGISICQDHPDDIERLSTIRTQSFLGRPNFSRMDSVISIFVRLMVVLLYYIVEKHIHFQSVLASLLPGAVHILSGSGVIPALGKSSLLASSMSRWSYWMDFAASMICTGVNQDFKRVIREIKVFTLSVLANSAPLRPCPSSILWLHDENHGILKQFYYGFISPSFFRKQETIFLYLFPMPWTMY